MRRALRIGIVGPDEGFQERAVRMCRTLSGALIEAIYVQEPAEVPGLLARGDLALLVLAGEEAGLLALIEHAERSGWQTPICPLPADLSLLEQALQLEEATGGASGNQRDLARLRRLILCARERAELAEALPAAAERYRAAFEHAAVGMVLVSPAGHILEVNRSLPALLGYRVDELLGLRPSDFAHPDDVDRSMREFATSGQERYEREKRYVHKDGQVVWVHLLVSAIHDANGQPRYFVGQLTDISKRKVSENESNESRRLVESIRRVQASYIKGGDPRLLNRELLRQLALRSASPDGFLASVELLSSGRFRVVMRATLGRFEAARAREERLERLPEAFELALGSSLLAQALQAGVPVHTEGRPNAPLGLPSVPVLLERCAVLPLVGEDGALGVVGLANGLRPYDRSLLEFLAPLVSTTTGVMASLEQVMKRRRAELDLRESQRALQTLMDNLPGMAYRCEGDSERSLSFASEGCLELTGFAPGDLIHNRSKSFGELVHPEDKERVQERIDWALLERQGFELQYRIVCASGREKWIWEQGCGVYDAAGTLLFVEGFLSDISAQRRAEEERLRLEARVQQSHKLESLGLLAGGIAHDFNNLLMGILGHAGLLKRQIEAGSPAAGSIAQIESAALRAARLTEHMLAFTGQNPIHPRPVDLSRCVRESAGVLAQLLPRGVHLEQDLAEDLPPVETDPAQLQQALVEVVRNSAEALEARGGRILISTRHLPADDERLSQTTIGPGPESGDFVGLSVHDDGPGMPEEVRLRAFDPFFTTKGFGRGLGLSTALGIVRSHGGFVQLRSGPTRGTELRMLFPVRSEPVVELIPRAPVALAAANGQGSVQQGTILIVDDEQLVRAVASALLEQAGFRVLEARDGIEGLELFRSHQGEIQAVLLDLSMPRLSGEETLVEIRKLRPEARILLTSGFSEQEAMHRIARRRGVAFIQKPYRLEELVERLTQVLAS
jgi:PAS domain S-box-containing protein